MIIRTGIGQDSHRFLPKDSSKPCVIGGIIFDNAIGFSSESDGDVILHAICNAVSSLTGTPILGGAADELRLKDGITDSEVYLRKGMETLGKQKISHVAITFEGKKPELRESIDDIRKNIARIMNLDLAQVGLTATSGEGLTDFGCGDGAQALCIITSIE